MLGLDLFPIVYLFPNQMEITNMFCLVLDEMIMIGRHFLKIIGPFSSIQDAQTWGLANLPDECQVTIEAFFLANAVEAPVIEHKETNHAHA